MNSDHDAMSALARSFPALHVASGLAPWRPEELEQWACGPVPGSGALHAARFVLSVWNSHADWECGRFDAVRALGAWDQAHRAAFLAWAARPWWP
ncbi:MAG: hypothetical protein M9894_27765 [Planctomycetes bacterium]|nr:hypothetical protein [Planctomycetota bacterium]MCO5170149.1 hypothetical protein [Planctomycetota bacterium]